MPSDGRSDLIALFLSGRRPTTLRAYQGDLRDFASFTGHEEPARCAAWLFGLDVGEANHAALRYRNAMAERGLSPATIERRLSMLKALSKMARMVGACSWTLEVEAPKVSKYRDTAGPGDGWHAILEHAREDTSPRGFRDVAILLTLHDLALRRAELINLDLADVEMGAEGPAALWVMGKGRSAKERFTLPRRTADALKRWIALRGPAAGPLFVRMDAGADGDDRGIPRMHVNSIYKLVGASGERAGLERRVRPHGLRHRAITAALDATRGDVRAVAKFSRHSSLDTLQKYDDNRRDLQGQVAAMVAGE